MAMKRVKASTKRKTSASHSFSITPHDTDEVNPGGYAPRAIRIGAVGGNLIGALMGDNGADQPYFVAPGETLPFEFEFIRATGTDAIGIIGLY